MQKLYLDFSFSVRDTHLYELFHYLVDGELNFYGFHNAISTLGSCMTTCINEDVLSIYPGLKLSISYVKHVKDYIVTINTVVNFTPEQKEQYKWLMEYLYKKVTPVTPNMLSTIVYKDGTIESF